MSIMSRNGFSLIELLVVVAIIAILMSLVMPAASAMRDSSRTVICLGHLRQIGLAFQGYASNNRGQVAPLKMDRSTGGTSWMALVAPYVEADKDGNHNGSEDWGEYSFLKSSVIVGCPIYRRHPIAWQPGYGMIGNLLRPESNDNNCWRSDGTSYCGGTVTNITFARLTNLSTRLLIMDNYKDESTGGPDNQVYRHQQKAGTLLCDGHAETLRKAQATIAATNPALDY